MKYTSNRKKLGMFLIISAKQQLGCYQLKNAAHQEMSDFGFVNVDFFSLEQAKLDNEWANVKEVNFTIFVQICFIQELPSDNTRMNTEMSNRSKFASPKRVASLELIEI